MKFVIAHKDTKRTIEGPFNICARAVDLAWLVKSIQESGMLTYGWVNIPARPEAQEEIPDTKPIGWEE